MRHAHSNTMRVRDRDARLLGWSAIGVLSLGLVLGGGTRQVVFSDLVLQFCSIAALAIGLIKLDWYYLPSGRRQLLFLALAVVSVALLQLVPLPTTLWAWFPGRDALWLSRQELALAEPIMRPWTTSPNATWACVRALIPALALLIIGVQLQEFWRRRLLGAILIAALVSVPLGLAQIVQGPTSELRFYTPTNDQQAVGLFANRNHYAALLYVGLALALGCFLTYDRHLRHRLSAKGLMQAFGWTLMGGFLMVGLMLSRSRAGVGLALLIIIAMSIVGYVRRRQQPLAFRWMLALLSLGALFAIYFGYDAFASRLQGDWLDQSRWQITLATLSLASDYAWLGTGLGSFPAAYAAFEPIDLLGDQVVNHAHNDWAELLVELGWVFVALFVYFVCWLGVSIVTVLKQSSERGVSPLLWASLAALLALLLHSLVDYPLRTSTMSLVWIALLLQILPNLPHDPAERMRGERPRKRVERLAPAATRERPLRERLRVLEGGQPTHREQERSDDPPGWD